MFRRQSDQTMAEDHRCGTHQFDQASARCRTCGRAYCGECLVYPFGARHAPFCVRCALVAAGVRPSRARFAG